MNLAVRFNKRSGDLYKLSNFYRSEFVYEGIKYRNVEAAFQAAKTRDIELKKEISFMLPRDAKRAGRSLVLRSGWEDVKYKIMVDVLMCKYTQNEDLKKILLSTGDALIIEDTTGWHDNIWGCCRCERCLGNEVSRNLLGQALMEVRAHLRGEINIIAVAVHRDKEVKIPIDLVYSLEADELRRCKEVLSLFYKYAE